MTSFVAKLQRTPKVRAVRTKIKKNEMERKKLSGEYKRLLKSESRRLSKGNKSRKRAVSKKNSRSRSHRR